MGKQLFKPDDRVAYWDDGKVVHLCDGADVHEGVRLLWTVCEIDVPANKAFSQDHSEFAEPNLNLVTCEKCKEKTQ